MAVQSSPPAPEFISYLFSPKPKFDCYFMVGNKSLVKPERIGAVKMMLIAHSEVMRLELEDSGLAEKGDVPVVDIYPDTFKTMLKYVYGYDTTTGLSFDEADDLLYVADKYMISSLKNKVAVKLMSLLRPANICSLLNNPACYTHLELKSTITRILRYETDKILTCSLMLELSSEGFLKILEQDGLAVPEIELWRAAVNWAKNKDMFGSTDFPLSPYTTSDEVSVSVFKDEPSEFVLLIIHKIVNNLCHTGSEDGQVVRQQLSPLAKHIRICTLSSDEIYQEVVTACVLSDDEVAKVRLAIQNQETQEEMTEICNEIEPRKTLLKTIQSLRCINNRQYQNNLHMCGVYTFTLTTKKWAIELLPLECFAVYDKKSCWENHVYWRIGITKIINPSQQCVFSVPETPMIVTYRKLVGRRTASPMEIPLVVDNRNVILLPNHKYTIKISSTGLHYTHGREMVGLLCDNDHLSWNVHCDISPMQSISYIPFE